LRFGALEKKCRKIRLRPNSNPNKETPGGGQPSGVYRLGNRVSLFCELYHKCRDNLCVLDVGCMRRIRGKPLDGIGDHEQ